MAHATLIAHICVWASTKKFQNFFSQKENNSFLFLLIFQNFQQQKKSFNCCIEGAHCTGDVYASAAVLHTYT